MIVFVTLGILALIVVILAAAGAFKAAIAVAVGVILVVGLQLWYFSRQYRRQQLNQPKSK